MKRITIPEGIAAAAVLACISLAADFMLRTLFAWHTAVKADIALLAVLYLGYLFYHSGIRAGKIFLSAGSMMILTAAVFFFDTLSGLLSAAVVTIWAMRSLLYASGVLSAFAHLALCLLGTAFAGYVIISGGGMATAAWCFFLMQSLWILIPRRMVKLRQAPQNAVESSRFKRAYSAAEAAIELLAKTSQAS
jgi:hypothetical protein